MRTSSKSAPAASRTARRFANTWRVWPAIPPSATSPVAGSTPTSPATWRMLPLRTACENAATGAGAAVVLTACLPIAPSCRSPHEPRVQGGVPNEPTVSAVSAVGSSDRHVPNLRPPDRPVVRAAAGDPMIGEVLKITASGDPGDTGGLRDGGGRQPIPRFGENGGDRVEGRGAHPLRHSR